MSYNRPWWPSGQSHHVSKFQIQVETEAKVPGLNPRSGLCVLPLLLLWLTRWVRVFPFSSALAYVTRFFLIWIENHFWGRPNLNPQPSNLTHDKLDHRTTVFCMVQNILYFKHNISLCLHICFVNLKYFLCFNTFLFCSLNDLLRGR